MEAECYNHLVKLQMQLGNMDQSIENLNCLLRLYEVEKN